MKALIAMSGGVDSSVAAYLMKQQGYECIGCTMKLFDAADSGLKDSKTCCSIDDVEDARSVAFRLGMPYYVFNYKDEFRNKVINSFIESYLHGLTPNPCIECNRHLKFAKLLDRARELGCDCIVTGHYARIMFDGSKYHLLRGIDSSKDQSYVLYSLTQEQLAMIKFPLGELSKDQVREIAASEGFVNAEKPDSQDICFVPDGNYASVIETHTGKTAEPGDFIDTEGNVIGRHKGIIHYTIGQRKGLGMGFGKPMFVLRTDPVNNTVTLGDNNDLFTTDVMVRDVNWTSGGSPFHLTEIENNVTQSTDLNVACTAKIRYRQQAASAKIYPRENETVLLRFDEPQRAPTPGQSAVFYQGEELIGGGIIL